MGAPKQKWTSEEESALKAGVVKHGAGKWRTILKDPEFSSVLSLRSNVDLKDKWRNMSVTANGWGSREKARMALKKSRQLSKHEDASLALSTVDDHNDESDVKSLAVASPLPPLTTPRKLVSKIESLIFEAITSLKEPSGSNKTAITMYIEDQYSAPPNLKKLLSIKLKALTANGKLSKVKRRYRIPPQNIAPSENRKSKSKILVQEGRQKEASRVDSKKDIKAVTKPQIDAELARMRNMSAEEAAAAAAQAVAEAEEAMAEAEEAAREAEAAEADAEAAEAFAEAALKTLKKRAKSNFQF